MNNQNREFNQRVKCKNCNKEYLQYQEDQISSCKVRNLDICPYCKQINNSSMEVEFSNYRID